MSVCQSASFANPGKAPCGRRASESLETKVYTVAQAVDMARATVNVARAAIAENQVTISVWVRSTVCCIKFPLPLRQEAKEGVGHEQCQVVQFKHANDAAIDVQVEQLREATIKYCSF